MERVGNLARHLLTNSQIGLTQDRLLEAQLQVGTGKVSQNYAGIAKDAARLVSLKANQVQVEQFIGGNDLIMSRLQVMETNVSQMHEIATKLRSLILQAQSDGIGTAVPLRSEAQNMLTNTVGLLNEQHANRYLFAGTMTSTPPVIDPVPNPTVWGVPDATYYQGNATVLSVRGDENFVVNYGITGDNIAFQELIGSLKAAISGAPPGGPYDMTRLDQSLDLVNRALVSLTDVRSSIGSAASTLDAANERHRDYLVNLGGFISDIEAVDVTEALTRLQSHQVLLEASYLTVARLSQVQLFQYLG